MVSDIRDLAPVRVGDAQLRIPTEIQALQGVTVRARHANVYYKGRLVKAVRNEIWVCPPAKYDQLTIDPLADCQVYGATPGTPGTATCRFMARLGHRNLRTLVLQQTEFSELGNPVEFLQLDALRISRRGNTVGDPWAASPDPADLAAGPDVIEEDMSPRRVYELQPGYGNSAYSYLFHFVCSGTWTTLDTHCRFMLTLGNGTRQAPVWNTMICVWLERSSECEVQPLHLAIETLRGYQTLSFGFIYPPWYGIGHQPRCSFQTYAHRLDQVQSSDAVEFGRTSLVENKDAAPLSGGAEPSAGETQLPKLPEGGIFA